MIDIFFKLCCAIMYGIGSITGFSYKEICVIGNLWVQGGLLAITGALPLCCYLYRLMNQTVAFSFGTLTITSILCLLYFALFAWVMMHYGTDFVPAFDLCVEDLQNLAANYHTTYNIVNIVIFVIGWLIAICANLFALREIIKM